ncbi:MAG: hypothetical protein ACTHV2_07865 [Brachybacterium sp.]
MQSTLARLAAERNVRLGVIGGAGSLLVDEAGNSYISSQDLALAIVDEIETPAHRRTCFTVAY